MAELKIEVKECDRLNNKLIDILAENTNHTKAWWKKEIEYVDRFYDKDKAIKLGIVNETEFEVK